MGGREVNDVFFTDCHVPADAARRRAGQAWLQLMAGLNRERLIIAAQSLGMAQRAFDDMLGLRQGTQAVRQADRHLPGDQHRIADLATELESTRLLIYDVAARVDANPGKTVPARGLDGQAQGDRAGQADRARGHADDGRLRLRDRVRHGAPACGRPLVTTIYGGTNEIQREIIAGTLGL